MMLADDIVTQVRYSFGSPDPTSKAICRICCLFINAILARFRSRICGCYWAALPCRDVSLKCYHKVRRGKTPISNAWRSLRRTNATLGWPPPKGNPAEDHDVCSESQISWLGFMTTLWFNARSKNNAHLFDLFSAGYWYFFLSFFFWSGIARKKSTFPNLILQFLCTCWNCCC